MQPCTNIQDNRIHSVHASSSGLQYTLKKQNFSHIEFTYLLLIYWYFWAFGLVYLLTIWEFYSHLHPSLIDVVVAVQLSDNCVTPQPFIYSAQRLFIQQCHSSVFQGVCFSHFLSFLSPSDSFISVQQRHPFSKVAWSMLEKRHLKNEKEEEF